MTDFLLAVVTAFGVVFVAELGDKTQLLAVGFGARHRLPIVALGLAAGFGAANALATLVGGVLGATLPERPIAIVAGILFLGFAVVTLLGDDDDDDGGPAAVRSRNVVATIALTILLAEMGDKTQLATAAMAARNDPVGTWFGATAGEVTAAMVGAFAGQRLGSRIDRRALDLASAALFAIFGILILVTA
jgi:putative Ca2+/H+ antiporter (TMEM165/GDT1 family)